MRITTVISLLVLSRAFPGVQSAPAMVDTTLLRPSWLLLPRDCSTATCPSNSLVHVPPAGQHLHKRETAPGRIADKIREGFQKMGEGIKAGFQKMGDGIKDTAQQAMNAVKDDLIKPIAQKVIQPAIDTAKKAVNTVGYGLNRGAQEIRKGLKDTVGQKGLKETIGQKGLKETIGQKGLKDTIGQKGLKDTVGKNLRKGGEKIKKFKDKVVSGLKGITQELGELGKKVKAVLRPQRRLSDQQRNVVKEVFKVLGSLVGAVGCSTLKLIPGANIAVEAICAASAVAETAVEIKQSADSKGQNGKPGTKVNEAVQEGSKAANGVAKAAKAEKAMSVLGKVSTALRLVRTLPVKKRSLTEGFGLQQRNLRPQKLKRPALQRRSHHHLRRRGRQLQRRDFRENSKHRKQLIICRSQAEQFFSG